MRILILADADKNVGLGHLIRCMSLADGFSEYDIEPLLLTNTHTLGLQKVQYDLKYANWLMSKKEKLPIFEEDWDIVIVDSYRINSKLFEKLKKHSKVIGLFDDEGKTNFRADVVINGNIYANCLNYRKKSGTTYLLGAQYTPLRKEFWKPQNKIIRKEIENVLITLGGSDESQLVSDITKSLRNSYPAFKINIIISNFYNKQRINSLIKNNVRVFLSPRPIIIRRLMSKADIALSGSGQTLNELACIGIPTIALVLAKNQEKNAAYWKSVGFIKVAGYWQTSNLIGKITNQIRAMETLPSRKRMSIIGRNLISRKGSLAIADYFINKIHERDYVNNK